LLQGTRFLAANPRMVQMGLGTSSLQNVAKGGFLLVVGAGIETLDFIFNDEKTMHDLVGGIGVEAVKAGLATMIGLSASMAVANLLTIVITPLVILADLVLLTSLALNFADDHWNIKENVIKALKKHTTTRRMEFIRSIHTIHLGMKQDQEPIQKIK
jgi:hypothetical protein